MGQNDFDVDAAFAALPRARLGVGVTPLHELNGLRTVVAPNGPRVLAKRDDLNGVGLGGNKLRKLEWLVGDALAQGYDCLLTAGAAQSNHARLTAAAGAMHNLPTHLALRGPEPARFTGNLILDEWLGAQVHFAPEGANVSVFMAGVAEDLRGQGRRPYVIPIGGSNAVGSVGYADAAREFATQCADVTHIVVAVGSGGTMAGLEAGVRLANLTAKVIGVGVGEPDTVSWNVDVANLANQVCDRLGARHLSPFAPSDIECPMDWMGPRYAAVTPEAEDAVRLLARADGVFTDLVYTGKAAAALIHWLREGRFAPSDTVVFWHTGGTPALFAKGH